MGPMWTNLQKDIDHEDPTPLIDQVFQGCTQVDAEVDPQAVQSKTELFKTLTPTGETDEKDQTNEISAGKDYRICYDDMPE